MGERRLLKDNGGSVGRPAVRGSTREVCTFRYDHDPATLAPRGRACKRSAVEEIHWKDGRTSVACREHGVEALTEDGKAEVLRVVRL